MTRNSTRLHAVIDLHERGFTEDFIQLGNKIAWIQEQALFPLNDFQVLERYWFGLPGMQIYTVQAVMLKSAHVKGILLSQQLVGKETGRFNRRKSSK